ncbi:prolactin-releasing peptide receptor-like [Mytilus trossulus]|uniref:prolactin-releasing peptide receptor-like n=1 Tax=Mytilus trossulus TaxID=6551 RepID=UPI003005FAC8
MTFINNYNSSINFLDQNYINVSTCLLDYNSTFSKTCDLKLNGSNASSSFRNSSSIYVYPPIPEDGLIGLIVLYSLTTLLSIAGNLFVVIVFARGRRSRTDLRIYLINLAASDLVMAIFCMPFTFADVICQRWVFPDIMCPLVLFLQPLSVAASVFTNMAIGVDRFIAVMFPLHRRLTYRRGKYVICIVWICAISLASIQLFVGKTTRISNEITVCDEHWPPYLSRKIYTVFILLLTYIIPLTILSITYLVIGIILWKRTAPGNCHVERDMHQLRAKIKVVKMLVIVVAIFGLCWLPLHGLNMARDTNPEIMKFQSQKEYYVFLGLYLTAHWLAMSNSFANPIIYGFTNESFRADLIVMLHNWLPCCACLRELMMRSYSLSTYDSMMYTKRNASQLRQTSCIMSNRKVSGRRPSRSINGLRKISMEASRPPSEYGFQNGNMDSEDISCKHYHLSEPNLTVPGVLTLNDETQSSRF